MTFRTRLFLSSVVVAAATLLVAAVLLLRFEADTRLSSMLWAGTLAFACGVGFAFVFAWATSLLLERRVRAITSAAGRLRTGEGPRAAPNYGTDEIGRVAHALSDAALQIGQRASELASDRARMEAILSGMIEGVLVVNDHGRVQLVNGAARRMLHLQNAPEDRHYMEIVRQPDIAAYIGAALRGAAADGLELTLPHEPELTLIARGAPITSPGATGAVLVLHDITDLRRADRIRRDFVANVSHELRTPLTAVRGYVEALLDGGAEPADVKRFLEIIGRHTLRMERLVRDLLRLARLDAGQETLEHVACPVESLFNGVETDLASMIEARDQTVEMRIASDAAVVGADPAKLHDALRNLLENATNYAPEGSTITMASERRANRIRLIVSDTGPGIPEADLPRVFERFYRVDKSRTRGARDPGGTGLGLAIVKHLIELQGGRVTAVNGPQGGAVFTIELKA